MCFWPPGRIIGVVSQGKTLNVRSNRPDNGFDVLRDNVVHVVAKRGDKVLASVGNTFGCRFKSVGKEGVCHRRNPLVSNQTG